MDDYQKAEKMGETLADLDGLSFVNQAKELLDASIKSSGALLGESYTGESRANAKVTLGFLNAFLNSYRVRLQFFRMQGVQAKVNAIKNARE